LGSRRHPQPRLHSQPPGGTGERVRRRTDRARCVRHRSAGMAIRIRHARRGDHGDVRLRARRARRDTLARHRTALQRRAHRGRGEQHGERPPAAPVVSRRRADGARAGRGHGVGQLVLAHPCRAGLRTPGGATDAVRRFRLGRCTRAVAAPGPPDDERRRRWRVVPRRLAAFRRRQRYPPEPWRARRFLGRRATLNVASARATRETVVASVPNVERTCPPWSMAFGALAGPFSRLYRGTPTPGSRSAARTDATGNPLLTVDGARLIYEAAAGRLAAGEGSELAEPRRRRLAHPAAIHSTRRTSPWHAGALTRHSTRRLHWRRKLPRRRSPT